MRAAGIREGLHRGHHGGQAALHVERSAAVELARAEFPFFKEADNAPALIEPLLKSENVKPFFFFFLERGAVYQEKELVNRFGNTK